MLNTSENKHFLVKLYSLLIYIFIYAIYQKATNLLTDNSMGIVVSVILLVIVIGFYFTQYREQLNLYNPNNYGQHSFTIKKLIFTFIMALAVICIIFIFFYIKFSDGNIDQLQSYTKNTRLQLFHVFISAPILEEFIFRAFYFNYFFNENNFKNKILCILTSSIFFAFLHTYNFSLRTSYFFFIGICLGATYMYTKDIRYAMLIHFFTSFINTPILMYIIK